MNTPTTRSPFFFKLHAAIMYKTGPGMPSGTGYAPQNGQLFFVDTSDAFPALWDHRANQQIDSRLLEENFRFMKVHHDYARTFVTLREMYNEEEAKAIQDHRPMRQVALHIETKKVSDPRTYNAPITAEVALIYSGANGEVPTPRSCNIRARSGGLQTIPIIKKCLEPCTYPLFFLKGGFGWEPGMKLRMKNADGTYGVARGDITQKDYYSFYLSYRDEFSPIPLGGKLFQQREVLLPEERKKSRVPSYNSFLSVKYGCHINVEICSVYAAIKYLFKYYYKGSDRAKMMMIMDEIAQYLDSRYLCPPEAIHRIYVFDLQARSNAVIRLSVHLPNKQPITFDPDQMQAALARNKKSSLMAYFEFNKKARDFVFASCWPMSRDPRPSMRSERSKELFTRHSSQQPTPWDSS